jgi:TolB-like protein/Tfp pilus assembly protein PilF
MSLFDELKRRKVIRVAVVYAATAFAVLQAADIMLPQMGVPPWALSLVVALVVLGFPIALVLGWALEVTPDGIKRTEAAPAAQVEQAATPALLGKRTLVVAGLLVVLGVGIGAGWFLRPVPVAELATDARIAADKSTESLSPAGSGASVAVLPFANRSAEPDSTYFVDGIHDELLTELARNGALKVISRTSMMQYRDTTKNLRQIGEELAVATILEGAVQRSGQRVRINAQLIDARSDAHLWAETFDRQLTPENLFEIQSEIASAIAAALGRTLGVDTRAPAPMAAPTANAQAYDLFLRARAMAADPFRIESKIRVQIELYREAVAVDPGFALAMGELGLALTDLYWFQTRQDAHRREAREWIDRALALAPNLPRLRWILARHLYHGELDYEGALAELALAERDMPGSADVFGLRGWILRRDGRMEEALEALNAAVALDPLSQDVVLSLSESHGWMGDLEQARTWAERLTRIPGASSDARLEYPALRLRLLGDTATLRRALAEHPPSADSYLMPEFLLLPYYERDFESALAAIEAYPGELLSEQFYRLPVVLLGALVANAGGQEEAARNLATAAEGKIDALLSDDPGDYRLMMSRALALALQGEADGARDWARRALDSPVVAKDTLLRSRLLGDRLRVLALVDESSTVARELEDYLGMPIKHLHFDGLVLDPVFDRHRNDPAFKALEARYSRKEQAQ